MKTEKEIRIRIPSQWNELSELQLRKIAFLFRKQQSTVKLHRKVFFILLALKWWQFKKRYEASLILKDVPLSELVKHFSFVYEQSSRTEFPKTIKANGKTYFAPMDRLQNLSASEFSVADDLHTRYLLNQELEFLKYLIAVLYVEHKQPRPVFDKNNLEDKVKDFNKVPVEELIAVHLAYQGCKNYIVKKYDRIFPKSKVKSTGKKFGFGKVIRRMTGGDLSKLDTLERINIYKFLDQFQDDLEEASKSTKK